MCKDELTESPDGDHAHTYCITVVKIRNIKIVIW